MRQNLIPAISTLAVVSLLAACGGGAGGPSGGGGKISDDKIVLGVINDQTGIYSELSGPNAVKAIEMAVEDFKAKHGDDAVSKNIEVVVADHQNKPEVANTKAQEMYDRQKADAIFDVPTSSAALAVAGQAQAKEKLYFNITAATTALITDIHSLGPDALAGTRFTDAWYWNFDQQNREWADKFKEKTGVRPSFAHAGNYSAAMNYLEAVQAAGTDASNDVVKNLEGKEINDFFLRNGKIRAEDHRVVHDAYLAEVKPKSDVKEEYDYEKIVTTIPADKAFKPVSESTCKMDQG